jgi:hypothetical protein
LQGCYVNIDDFLCRYRVMKRRFGAEGAVGMQSAPCVGNQSHL